MINIVNKLFRKAKKVLGNKETRRRLYEKLNVKKIKKDSYYINQFAKQGLNADLLLIEWNEKQVGIQQMDFLEREVKRMPSAKVYVAYEEEAPEVTLNGREVTLVLRESKQYRKLLAEAGTILSMGVFSKYFIKKQKQQYRIYLTDIILIQMKQSHNLELICRIQRNLFMANQIIVREDILNQMDPLLFPRKLYTGEILTENLQRIDFPKTEEKQSIVLYAGGLEKNGITTSLMSLIATIGIERYDFYVVVERKKISYEAFVANELYGKVGFLFLDELEFSWMELAARAAFYQANRDGGWVKNKLDTAYTRLFAKYYAYISADVFIHFTGYVSDLIWLYEKAPAKRVIYVHNDMDKEIKSKGYQHRLTLQQAYGSYDCVIPVTEDILPQTRAFNPAGTYCVVNNCHDYKKVVEKAKAEVSFDTDTVSTHTVKQVTEILASDCKKIITIGRFSKEKGHAMLIDAYSRYYQQHKDSYLIIIGGYGKAYKETLSLVEKSPARNQIVLIKSLKNPMPILRQCDLFILSSLYEGLGLTLLEADTLNIPVISTKIDGPRGFMQKHGGMTVSPDADGLYQGMQMFEEGNVHAMRVDYKQYNEMCSKQFNNMIETVMNSERGNL